jgi:hypothetical protein
LHPLIYSIGTRLILLRDEARGTRHFQGGNARLMIAK